MTNTHIMRGIMGKEDLLEAIQSKDQLVLFLQYIIFLFAKMVKYGNHKSTDKLTM